MTKEQLELKVKELTAALAQFKTDQDEWFLQSWYC